MKKGKARGKNVFLAGMCAASAAVIVYCLQVYLHVASYVMPAADDFIFYNTVKESRMLGEGYLQLALKRTVETYFTWQGTFVTNFLCYYAAPYVRMGADGIRFFCRFSILLFYGSLWMFIDCIMKYLLNCKKNTVILFVCALATWQISNARVMMESFFWFNGICAYTLPIVFALFGIRHFIKYAFVEGWKRDLVGAIVFGFLACGGVLQCAAIVCFVYLLICIWGFFADHPKKKKMSIVFITALISALINCLAPGNYTRQSVINKSGLPIFRAFGYSLSNVLGEFARLLSETDMPYLLMTMTVVGFLLWYKEEQKIRVDFRMSVLAGLGIFLCMWISCYPVALGYSSLHMEPRGYFIIDIFLIIGFMFCMFMMGRSLRQLAENYVSKRKGWCGISVAFVIVVCVALNVVIPVQEIERPLKLCVEDVNLGYLVRFRDMWRSILDQIENSDEANVIVQSRLIPSPQELKNPDLSSDSDYWINVGVAEYFGKESVQVEWLE